MIPAEKRVNCDKIYSTIGLAKKSVFDLMLKVQPVEETAIRTKTRSVGVSESASAVMSETSTALMQGSTQVSVSPAE